MPAFLGAIAAFAWWLFAARRAGAVADDSRRAHSWIEAHTPWIVGVIAALALVATIAFNGFSANGSDASGYLSHAVMLLDGELTYREPMSSLARWAGGEATLAPLGWLSVGEGVQVPTYAVGLPLLMAPLHAIGGATAASLIVPFSFALAVVATGALALRIGGSTAAILAATWLATSPVALVESMQIMSDVPVTAAWLSAWWLVFRDRPWAAGVVAAAAVLIRPNIAPVAILPAAFALIVRGRGSVVRFSAPVAIAAAIVAFLQWLWFGSPLRSGYGSATEIYSWSNVLPNVSLYTSWLLRSHGPWLLAAPLALLPPSSSRELRWLLAFAAAVVAAYLAYSQFEVWTYLRFLLPALAVAVIAVAALAASALGRISMPARAPVLSVLVLAVAGTNLAAARQLDVFRFAERSARARTVGEPLARAVAVHAAIVSGEQSGAMRYYTKRAILRWDVMDDAAMREAVEALTLDGYELWVVLDDWEEEAFRRRLPWLASMSLDYEPTLESAAGVGIRTRAWRVPRFTARSSNSE